MICRLTFMKTTRNLTPSESSHVEAIERKSQAMVKHFSSLALTFLFPVSVILKSLAAFLSLGDLTTGTGTFSMFMDALTRKGGSNIVNVSLTHP